MAIEDGETGQPWSKAEVEAIVDVYFQMLRRQEMGQRVNKTEHNRRLLELLKARNLASIEYKHRNISAVLNLLGAQSLDGYKPLPNFQQRLLEVVSATLERDQLLDEVAIKSVETPAEAPLVEDFSRFIVSTPKPKWRVFDEPSLWTSKTLVKRDYLEREARNRSLGLAGELLVIEFEQRRLHAEGARKLAERVEHVSRDKGDGAGYDILSFDANGRDRYIEVKTTAYAAETPFFVSKNEVRFSEARSEQFHLYRLFSFRRMPRAFVLSGSVAANCLLDATTFRATLLGNRQAANIT